MKKRINIGISFLTIIILGILFLNGCKTNKECNHVYAEATCTQAKTCTVCGQTFGAPLGHAWKNATCTQAKTCTVCGLTSGAALGHSWKNATCKSPQYCTVCNQTKGQKSDHIDNGSGLCKFCNQDIFLLNFKKDISIRLIIPTVGSYNNRCQVEFINKSNSDLTLWRFVFANGSGCDNYSDEVAKGGYKTVVTYFTAPLSSERYNPKYNDMYLDNNSDAHTYVTWKGKEVCIKFDTKEITAIGYTFADIGVY